MKSARQIQEGFEEYLQGLDYSRQPDELYAPIRYVLALGGKRIRPTFLIMAYNMYADDIERVYNTAAGMEIFHNFTLLHDDLMDKADLRRGKATVHKKWNENTAILSGDGMLVLAYRYLVQTSEPDLHRVLDLANKTFTLKAGVPESGEITVSTLSRKLMVMPTPPNLPSIETLRPS